MLTDSLTSLSKSKEDNHGSLPPKVRRYITHCYTPKSGENAGCIKAILQPLYLSEKTGFLPNFKFYISWIVDMKNFNDLCALFIQLS
jgi:hypothetical protein